MSVKPLLDAWRDYVSLRDEPQAREWFDGFDWALSERNLVPQTKPVLTHLQNAVSSAGRAESRLAQELQNCVDQLEWRQSYTADDFGQGFVDNYAHVQLIGPQGHFASEELAGGLVLYGPGLDYCDHWHVAEEIYIPLTPGAHWSQDREDHVERGAGAFIYHTSNMPHAIKTSNTPLLALWAWSGGDLTQKGNY